MLPAAFDELVQELDVEPQPSVDTELFEPELFEAVEHAHGTSDSVFAPAPPPRSLQAVAPSLASASSHVWLPEGFHFGLHIIHYPLENSGPFTGGGNKWTWHITVSSWFSLDPIIGVLDAKRAAPHLAIGGRPGWKHPVVVQMIPFNMAGRALMHTFGPETNRADTIQVEICANVADVPNWSEKRYEAFANLVRLSNNVMTNKHEVPRVLARKFTNTDRFGAEQFVSVKGHHGHMHVPGNDHFDPTAAFKGSHLLHKIESMPRGGYRNL